MNGLSEIALTSGFAVVIALVLALAAFSGRMPQAVRRAFDLALHGLAVLVLIVLAALTLPSAIARGNWLFLGFCLLGAIAWAQRSWNLWRSKGSAQVETR